MTKTYIFLIALVLLTQITIRSAGQENNLQFNDTNYIESVCIHTDRDFYIAGERIYFRLNVEGNSKSPVSSLAYIALRNQDNTIISIHTIRLTGNSGSGSIYLPDTLSSQPCQLVAFTNWMRNFSHDFYATRQLLVVNRFDEEPGKNTGISMEGFSDQQDLTELMESSVNYGGIRIITDKASYGSREKIRMQVIHDNPADLSGSLSVSVARRQSMITSPHQSGTENTMNDVIPKNPENIKFLKEMNGPIITGRVTEKAGGRPLADVMVVMTTPDTILNLQYARTLTDGTFHFMLNDFHEGRELFFTLHNLEITPDAEIKIIDKFSLNKPFVPDLQKYKLLSSDYVKTSQDIVRTNKTLNIDYNKQVETEKFGYRNLLYSSPAYSFDLFGDYEYLGSMHEISRELIPFLRIRRQGTNFSSTMMLDFAESYYQEAPVYFLDGIYTDNVNRIIHLDSDDLNKLEIHNYKWRHGELIFPGIVALFSKNQEYRNIQLSDPSLLYEHGRTAYESTYQSPDHGKNEISRSRPDFRQLLFWEPDLLINTRGASDIIEFYTGDIPGDFVIRVEGNSNNGNIAGESAILITKDADVLTARKVNDADFDYVTVKSGSADKPVHLNQFREDNESYRYFEQGLSGMVNLPPRRPIGDQHYPSEDWILGNILLENEIEVKDKLFRYNGYLDELFWLPEVDYQQVKLDKKLIREFELLLPGNLSTAKFRRIYVNAPLYFLKNEIFGEVLHEGEHLSLFAYRRVMETTRENYVAGNRIYGGMLIKPSHLYIIELDDGSTRVIRRLRRRSILDLFPENRNEIRSILRENKIWIRTGKDLTKTVKLIDDYLSGKIKP